MAVGLIKLLAKAASKGIRGGQRKMYEDVARDVRDKAMSSPGRKNPGIARQEKEIIDDIDRMEDKRLQKFINKKDAEFDKWSADSPNKPQVRLDDLENDLKSLRARQDFNQYQNMMNPQGVGNLMQEPTQAAAKMFNKSTIANMQMDDYVKGILQGQDVTPIDRKSIVNFLSDPAMVKARANFMKTQAGKLFVPKKELTTKEKILSDLAKGATHGTDPASLSYKLRQLQKYWDNASKAKKIAAAAGAAAGGAEYKAFEEEQDARRKKMFDDLPFGGIAQKRADVINELKERQKARKQKVSEVEGIREKGYVDHLIRR